MAKRRRITKKTKKKELVRITLMASKEFRNKEITDTMVVDPQHLINRKFYVNLADLTSNFSKYYIKIYFRIVDVKNGKAITEFDSSECLREYISRMIHRRIKRIDVIKDAVTKDGVKLRVKVVAVAYKGITGIQKTKVRKIMWKVIEDYVSKVTLSEFIKKSIIGDELKNLLMEEVKKVYPLRNLEIRKVERKWETKK